MMRTKKHKRVSYDEITRGKKSNSKTNHLKGIKEKYANQNQFETKKSKNTINQTKSSNKATLHVESTETPSTSSNTEIKALEPEEVTEQITETTVQDSPNLLDNNEGRLTESAKTSIQKNQQMFMCSVYLEDIKSQVKYQGQVEEISEKLNHTEANKNSSFVHNQTKNSENKFKPKTNKNTIHEKKTICKAKQVESTNKSSQTSKKNKDEKLNTKRKTKEPKGTETTVKISSNLPNKNEGILTENAFFKGTGNKKPKRVSFKDISNGNVQKQTKSTSKNQYLKNTLKSINMKEKDVSEKQFETKKSKNTKNRMKSSNKATHVESTETPSTSSNTEIKALEPKEVTQQISETTVENSPNLLDNNEERLPESAILEALNHTEHTSKMQSTVEEMKHRRPSCIIHAYYQGPSNSNRYKRKLSNVKEVLNNYLKRFKNS